MEFILGIGGLSAQDREKTGDKAVTLSQFMGAGLPVPDGFVVTNVGLNEFFKENSINDAVSDLLGCIGNCGLEVLAEKSKKVRELIISGKMPNKLKEEIKAAYGAMGVSRGMQEIDPDRLGAINAGGNNCEVAVKSSVFTSGSKKISFKGFYPSYLYVNGLAGLTGKIKECWADLYRDEVIFAKQKYNGGQDIFAGVIVQKMIDGEKSGVCATANPVTKNMDEIVIESSFGCGFIGGGEITPDIFIVDKASSTLKGKKINPKEWRLVKHAVSGNVIKEKISPEMTNAQSINDNEAALVSELSKKVEAVSSSPVYVEWVCKRDKVYAVDISRMTTFGRQMKPVYNIEGSPVFSGIAASSGGAEGFLKKVHDISDIVRIKAGDILVTPVLQPETIPVLNRAGGVISENGGILSNMSVLCCELDIPLVVGCAGACGKLPDGSRVAVDATSGKVYVTEASEQNNLNHSQQDTSIAQLSPAESAPADAQVYDVAGESVEGEEVSAVVQPVSSSVDSTSSKYAYDASDTRSQVAPAVDEQVSSFKDSGFGVKENKAEPVLPRMNKVEDVGSMIEDDPLNMITGTKVKVLARSLDKPEILLDGVGLLPSELVLLNLGKHPDKILSEGMEEELVKYIETKFSALVESVYPKPLTFRTLSAQTSTLQKLPESGHEVVEENPKIGWRGLRRSLDSPALFRAEIKALNNLMLKGYNNIEVLLPFVQHPNQISEVMKIFRDCGVDPEKVKVGISIEAPASGLVAKEFARSGIDFVFIDCDRVAEHMLGVDAANEKVRKHFDSKHPGVLKMIKMIIEDYKKSKLFVSVGGSILDDPDIIERLVGFGVDAIVVPSEKIKVSKYVVARVERKLLLDIMRERRGLR
ncbi:MAG: PEP/pyruvate-binding domain-containing protein [archaeon]|nr:PEP/pyruvate-binding domain-containing protein [archaeon]